MSAILEIADQYAVADAVFADAEHRAYQANDDTAFDKAVRARKRNDQAYFLYLFTKYEAEVDVAIPALLARRTDASAAWPERRIWQAWSRGHVRDIAFLSKMEVLTDKGRKDYATAKQYYEGRNTIAHGQDWEVQFFLPAVAQNMHELVQRWVTI
jgi:hypothetical protein